MGDSASRLSELGFSEFVSKLITDVMDAVISSLLDQEKKVAELKESMFLNPADFAKRYIPEQNIRSEILALFPDVKGTEGKSSVDPGAPYEISKEKEEPPIFDLTGYRLTKGDIEKGEQGLIITKTGYENIMSAVGERLAKQHQEHLMTLLKNGIPRIYVDNGHILAKLNFKMEEQMNKMSLRVSPLNTRGPEFLTLKADITSEVEITFKTITQ